MKYKRTGPLDAARPLDPPLRRRNDTCQLWNFGKKLPELGELDVADGPGCSVRKVNTSNVLDVISDFGWASSCRSWTDAGKRSSGDIRYYR